MEKAFYICGKVFLYIWKKENILCFQKEDQYIRKEKVILPVFTEGKYFVDLKSIGINKKLYKFTY